MSRECCARNITLYRTVLRIRMVEEAIRHNYHMDEMKTPVHLSLGEEAILAGVNLALDEQDLVFGTYRNHGLYLANGGPLGAFFAELFGKDIGIAHGKAGSMHISDPGRGFLASSAIVASIIPVALGAAFAANQHQGKPIVAVFFGDGATEEGVFWETLNAASIMALPLLFVCEDNGLAIHSHIQSRQSYVIPEVPRSFGIPVVSTDSTDADAIHRIAIEAVRHVRHARSPYFLHCKYHRYLEHVGICEDYEAGYRCREQAWLDRDPVAVLQNKLLGMGVPHNTLYAVEAEIAAEITDAIAEARDASFPPDACLWEGLYA